MSLRAKFIFAIISSILFIALVNIIAFYIFYSSYVKIYFYEKIEAKQKITLEYINEIIKKQTIDEIDSIFSDTEIEFFELLEIHKGEIPLNKQKNTDIVIDYLVKSGVAPKYIEKIIPTDSFQKIINAIKTPDTPEAQLVKRILYSILVTNLLAITLITIVLVFFIRKTLNPISKITNDIKSLNNNLEQSNQIGNYHFNYQNKNDEVGLLVEAINNLNKKLGVQNTIRTRLLADISHELKTPITSIQTYLEGISDGIIELNDKNLKAISTEMERLINLVNMIMDYEKFDRSTFSLKEEKIDIPSLLKEITETHKKRLKNTKQRIKITGEQELTIKADKDLLTQVIHNLIGNFLKYSGKKTLLKIIVNKKYIEFSDNGKGIKSSEVELLTEKFYQGDNEKSGDAQQRGIGVGLSIVAKIIHSHGWKYSIKSEKDKGFSFKIYIK